MKLTVKLSRALISFLIAINIELLQKLLKNFNSFWNTHDYKWLISTRDVWQLLYGFIQFCFIIILFAFLFNTVIRHYFILYCIRCHLVLISGGKKLGLSMIGWHETFYFVRLIFVAFTEGSSQLKGATKLYFMNYSRVVIILFSTGL